VEPVRTPVQVNELVRNLVALQKFASADEIAVKAELADRSPTCSMDRDLVAGALENLLQNAFEATPQRDDARATVTVRTALAQRGQTEGVCCRSRTPAWDERADARAGARRFLHDQGDGSGLGLAFVRRVAEAHGGDVSLISKEGAGTTVRMFLPLG
jgi:signal transduction histidine kinase